MNTLTFTFLDGTKHTRTTKHAYTHVRCALKDGRLDGCTWHHTEAAARRNGAACGRPFIILPVDPVTEAVPADVARRNARAAAFWGIPTILR